jgi:hypothetical protein
VVQDQYRAGRASAGDYWPIWGCVTAGQTDVEPHKSLKTLQCGQSGQCALLARLARRYKSIVVTVIHRMGVLHEVSLDAYRLRSEVVTGVMANSGSLCR